MVGTSDDEVLEFVLAELGVSSDAARAAGKTLFEQRSVDRGAHVLRAGERAHEVQLVVSGLLREYYLLADGLERTKSFVVERQFAGSLPDLLSEAPCRIHIVAEEPTELLVAEFSELRRLGLVHSEWAKAEASVTQRLLLTKTDREYELLALDADGRYDAFQSRFPGVEARVASRHVASYVGVTPVHLSRLRRTRRERAKQ